jgi:hypothetical protein
LPGNEHKNENFSALRWVMPTIKSACAHGEHQCPDGVCRTMSGFDHAINDKNKKVSPGFHIVESANMQSLVISPTFYEKSGVLSHYFIKYIP